MNKNVATVKCKRVETATKYGSEHCISPKTGPKQPKMAKNEPNALKFIELYYFLQKFPIIDPVHLSMVFKRCFGQKTAIGCNWGLVRDPKWLKKASK